MTTQAVQDALRKHPFVQGFKPRRSRSCAAFAKEVRFEPDKIIFREGDECPEFYLIVPGRVGIEIAAPADLPRRDAGRRRRIRLVGDPCRQGQALPGAGAPVEALAFEGGAAGACREDPAWAST